MSKHQQQHWAAHPASVHHCHIACGFWRKCCRRRALSSLQIVIQAIDFSSRGVKLPERRGVDIDVAVNCIDICWGRRQVAGSSRCSLEG